MGCGCKKNQQAQQTQTTQSQKTNESVKTAVTKIVEKYYNKSVDEIEEKLDISLNKKAKSYYASLSKRILGVDINNEIEEFAKADIVVKTVRLKENNTPKEDISFPTFKYDEIIDQEWDESDFKEILEHKFLFIFFKIKGDKLILKKVKFWNMPYADLEKVMLVWEKTRQIIKEGGIVSEVTSKGIRKTNFPNKKFSLIAHVRPHAQNANDTYLLPILDKVTGMNSYTKHCFWLNSTYIRDEIYLK
jgi:hypothetical protein